jgi:hypothetical protein
MKILARNTVFPTPRLTTRGSLYKESSRFTTLTNLSMEVAIILIETSKIELGLFELLVVD